MGRRRKPRAGKHRDADPEAVLAGREEVSAGDLFRLIHRVNPTGRNLAARESRRRYDQKSRLQSLLIRRFGELVVVEPADGDGLASLSHRSGTFDACHAVVADLEPDARAWVRRRLDLAASPELPDEALVSAGPASDDEPDGVSAGALVARAERAVTDYEYDVAERCLESALEKTGGPEAALPLLELRVQLLGMDAEALEVEARLTPRAREHSRIRTLLALAAARLDEVERALDLVRGVPATAAADVYAALVHGAVGRRDRESAERFLAETEILDPAQARLPELRLGVTELVADDVRPAEEELAERHRREGALAVEDEARSLLERWAESEVARGVLQEAGEIKRRREIEDALANAETALAEERFRDAEKHFRTALEAGSDRPGLKEQAAEARRRAEEREDEERLAAVVRAFAEDGEHAAHLAYLTLSEPLRQRARREIGRRSLDWLEEAGAPPSGQRAHAAVSAVLALESLATREERDPRTVVDELAPHMKTLRGVGEARRLLEEAEEGLAEERLRLARAALDDAIGAFDDGRLDELADLLGRVEPGELDADGRATYEKLRERQRQRETFCRLVEEYESSLADDDLLAARERAGELAEMPGYEEVRDAFDESREDWRREAERLRQSIRRRWAMEIDPEKRPLCEVRDFRPDLLYETLEAWLDDDAREIVLADVKGEWLFIRVIDLERQTVTERVSLRPPTMRSPVMVWREGDLVCFVDESGTFLELSRSGWEVVRSTELYELVPDRMFLRGAFPTPGSPHLWIEATDFDRERFVEESCLVLDLDALRVARRRSTAATGVLLHPDGPWVVCRDAHTRIFSARGVEVPGWRLPKDASVSPAPDGALVTVDEESDDAALLTLRRADAEAERSEDRLRVPACRLRRGKLLATNLDEEVAFLQLWSSDEASELLAAEISEGRLKQRYRVPFVWDAAFAQDRWGRHLFAVQLAGDHLRVQPLGPSPPPPGAFGPPVGTAEDRRVPSFEGPYPCEVGGPLDFRGVYDPTLEVPELQERFLRDMDDDPFPFVSGLLQMRNHGDMSKLEEVLLKVLERLPENPAAHFAMAVLATDKGHWDEVHRWLGPIVPGDVSADCRRHYYHLVGLSRLARGRFLEAREAFAAGSRHRPGRCSFDQLIELTEVLEELAAGELAAADTGIDQPLVWQVCGAILDADRALDSGDPAAAVAAVDRPAVWRAREVQSAARLAAAWLEIELATPGQLFDKRQGLAFFHAVHYEVGRETQELPSSDLGPGFAMTLVTGSKRRSLDVPPFAWDRPRLDGLAKQAYLWLDTHCPQDDGLDPADEG